MLKFKRSKSKSWKDFIGNLPDVYIPEKVLGVIFQYLLHFQQEKAHYPVFEILVLVSPVLPSKRIFVLFLHLTKGLDYIGSY